MLITGRGGYLGSKMVHVLVDAGEPVVVSAKAQRQSLVARSPYARRNQDLIHAVSPVN
jgi:UDP-glucose 4-epimerase